jgi:hypothetical protein
MCVWGGGAFFVYWGLFHLVYNLLFGRNQKLILLGFLFSQTYIDNYLNSTPNVCLFFL